MLLSGPPHASSPLDSFQSPLDTCIHHTLLTTGVWLFLFASQLPPAGLCSSRSSLLSARSTPKKTRIPPRTFTQAWVILPSLPGIDATAPSSSPTTVPRLLSTATKTPPDVCLRSSLLALSSVIISASAAKSPSFLGFSVELLIHFLLPQSVLNPKKRYRTFLDIFSCTSSLCSTLIHSTRCMSVILPLSSFQSCLLSLAASTFVESPPPICLLLDSCCILSIASVLLRDPSAAALTHIPLCSSSKRRRNHLPVFARSVSLWGVALPFYFPFLSHPLSSSE